MDEGIFWGTDVEAALRESAATKKLVIIVFFDSGCAVCRQMESLTYADAQVMEFIIDNFVPLRFYSTDQATFSAFNVSSAPSVVIMDSSRKEYYRACGFQSPEDVIASLTLGIAKLYFENGNFRNASVILDRVISDCPEGASIPEAIYFRGLCRYMHSKDVKVMNEVYTLLHHRFPENEWTQRASAYKTL